MKLRTSTTLPGVIFLVSLFFAAPATGEPLLGIQTDTGVLYRISTVDASLAVIGNTGVENLVSLEFAPDGTLYSFSSGTSPVLYEIDPVTAQATPIRPLAVGTDVFEGGLAFAPDGRVFGTNGGTVDDPLLFGLDLVNGNDFTIGTLNSGAPHDIGGLAWRGDANGVLIGLDRVSGFLFEIDPVTAVTTDLIELHPGIVAGVIGGMTIVDVGGTKDASIGYFSTAAFTGTNALYRFDPYTGAHTLVGEFDPDVIRGVGISGLAFVPEPTSFLLLLLGGMTLLRRWRVAH